MKAKSEKMTQNFNILKEVVKYFKPLWKENRLNECVDLGDLSQISWSECIDLSPHVFFPFLD